MSEQLRRAVWKHLDRVQRDLPEPLSVHELAQAAADAMATFFGATHPAFCSEDQKRESLEAARSWMHAQGRRLTQPRRTV